MPKTGRFRKEPKLFRLKFEDPDMEGLVVVARSLPIGSFLGITELAAAAKDDPQAGNTAKEMFRAFAGSLIEWNLDDEFGDAVPATYDGICTQELDFIMSIVTAWMSAMADVARNLPQTSSAGSPALEASLPMAPLSQNPPS